MLNPILKDDLESAATAIVAGAGRSFVPASAQMLYDTAIVGGAGVAGEAISMLTRSNLIHELSESLVAIGAYNTANLGTGLIRSKLAAGSSSGSTTSGYVAAPLAIVPAAASLAEDPTDLYGEAY